MCGLAAVLADPLSADDVVELAALGDLMARRGPDDAGSWDDGRHCALAFRRLSIIDTSPAGHQPMVSGDGRHVLVFNGEVYNYRELRAELEGRGETFRSQSDTEVVLVALLRWGVDALTRFNGMFALAWWRGDDRSLVVARDPIGIKPLYFSVAGGAFVVGSQYDQVIRHRRARAASLDGDAVSLFMRLGSVPAPYGVLSDTGQVRPGHYIVRRPSDAGMPRQVPFRRLDLDGASGPRLRGAEAFEAVADVVDSAVRRQRVADVPLGCLLSGGVDSPLVAGALSAASSSPVDAFTIGTRDVATDESAAASRIAEALGLRHHLRSIDEADAFAMIDDVAAAYQEPFGDPSAIPTMLVSKLAGDHVTVALSGDGGDELFWGYPRFSKLRRARRWFLAPRPMRVAAYAASKPLRVARRPARGIMFPTIGDWYLDAHSAFHGDELATLAPPLAARPRGLAEFVRASPGSDDELAHWMRVNEMTHHLPMILTKVDRASMYHSLEVRVPLLDLDVIDVAARIDPLDATDRPGAGRLGDVRGKLHLRHALGQHISPDQIQGPKKGFSVPLHDWFRGQLATVVHDQLLAVDPEPAGVFDRAELTRFVADHRSGRRDHTRALWHLLAFQMWANAHNRPLGSH